jgi:molybdate transport system substrate-binding protein
VARSAIDAAPGSACNRGNNNHVREDAMSRWSTFATAAAAGLAALLAGPSAKAASIDLMTTGAVEYILRDLIPPFELATGHKVNMSVLGTVIAVDKLNGGAAADLVLLNPDVLGDLQKAGKIVPGSITPVFHSRAGVAVRAGAAKPDISTVEAFKQALLKAKTVGHSIGVSGVHLSTRVFPQLGIADEIKPRIRIAKGVPVGVLVAKGEAEIGIHQIAELLPVPGIDIVGELPAEIQTTLVYATGIHANAKQPEAARALANLLLLEMSVPAIKKNGMEPAPR